MKHRLLGCVIAGVLIAGMAISPAAADPRFDEFTAVGVSRYMAAPTPFTVAIDGPDPVCSMLYEGTTLTGPPWTFMWTIPQEPEDMYNIVDITLCNGSARTLYFEAGVPFQVVPAVLSPDALGASAADVMVWAGNFTPAAATLSVADSSGRVLSSMTVQPGARVDSDGPGLRVPLGDIRSTTTLTQTITGSGLTMSAPVVVARGWAAIYGMTEGAFAPCSTVIWSYDAAGQPRAARTFKSDVVEGFRRLSALTGLTFREVPAGQVPAPSNTSMNPPGIVLNWKDLGNTTAQGGTDGVVTFNTKDRWATEKYRGFGHRYPSPAGRGWMIVHEVMHTLWLDHVTDPKAIMSPVNRGQHAFTVGDRQGLASLYPRAGCA